MRSDRRRRHGNRSPLVEADLYQLKGLPLITGGLSHSGFQRTGSIVLPHGQSPGSAGR